MPVKRKRKVVRKTVTLAAATKLRKQIVKFRKEIKQLKLKANKITQLMNMNKTLRKNVTQWKTKCSQQARKNKQIKELAYKKGFNDALKAFTKMQKAEAKILKVFKKDCKKAISTKKTTRRKVAKKRITARKSTRRTIKAKPRSRSMIRETKSKTRSPSRARVLASRRALRGNSSHRRIRAH